MKLRTLMCTLTTCITLLDDSNQEKILLSSEGDWISLLYCVFYIPVNNCSIIYSHCFLGINQYHSNKELK